MYTSTAANFTIHYGQYFVKYRTEGRGRLRIVYKCEKRKWFRRFEISDRVIDVA